MSYTVRAHSLAMIFALKFKNIRRNKIDFFYKYKIKKLKNYIRMRKLHIVCLNYIKIGKFIIRFCIDSKNCH